MTFARIRIGSTGRWTCLSSLALALLAGLWLTVRMAPAVAAPKSPRAIEEHSPPSGPKFAPAEAVADDGSDCPGMVESAYVGEHPRR
jgi:hypothetical protein